MATVQSYNNLVSRVETNTADRAATFPSQGKLLALDVGLARIGIAVCDPLRLAARPHSTLTRGSRREDFAHLAEIAKREAVMGVVCGLPLNMDGSAGPQAQTTRKWAMRLAHALRVLLGAPLPIAMWDERLSSYSAQELMPQWPRHGEDALAATVILQSFLAAQKRGEHISEVIDLPERVSTATADHDEAAERNDSDESSA
jgi:putative holliday junction resolvase